MVLYGVQEPVHVAAGACIAYELGVEVTDDEGEPIDWSLDDEIPVIVFGWPEPHRQVIEGHGSRKVARSGLAFGRGLRCLRDGAE